MPQTLAGAGDIGLCGSTGAEETARLLDAIPGTVFTTGDNAYPDGSRRAFTECYEPTWGRHKARTKPSPGNHEYESPGAAPYFEYFGGSAGDGSGYYTYRLGAWEVFSLNSNIATAEGSPQYEWLRSQLAGSSARCTLAYWHHPVTSSGPHGDNVLIRPLWRLLARNGAEVIIAGHDHIYERFAPMDAELTPAPNAGVRSFIAGTGGAATYSTSTIKPNSEVRASVRGVLKFTLWENDYSWEFVGVPGSDFHDTGEGRCH